MQWNEKIDLIKQNFSADEFSIPTRDGKSILRNIESKFIARNRAYYDINKSNERFCNWWDNLKYSTEFSSNQDIGTILAESLEPSEHYWIACEFEDVVYIYKATLSVATFLISQGLTWTSTFHLIHTKYHFHIGLKLDDDCIWIRKCGKTVTSMN